MSANAQSSNLSNTDLDVLVVGAGFSGLYNLHRIRKAGFSVKLFEAGSSSGGVWHWNCYPGARTDSPFSIYQLSIEELWKDWTWKEHFPSQKEVTAYFKYVEEKLDLRRDILFDTRVKAAHFDTTAERWVVSTENGITVRPRFLILCTGLSAKPFIPDYKGLDTFKGTIHHTSLWPKEGVDMKGKRIGVIGTGASGVQVIQEVGPYAGHLTVFQRTPNLALPMVQRPLDKETQVRMKDEYYPMIFGRRKQTFGGFIFGSKKGFNEVSPEERYLSYEEAWEGGGLGIVGGSYFEVFFDETANNELYEFWKKKVRARISDPRMREKLAPDVAPHPIGAKRPSLEQQYYEVFNLPHVDLIDVQDNPITEITSKGVKTADGIEHELDVLALATGFDAVTGSISRINLQGTDGVTLGDKWKKGGLSTYLGLTSVNFPNIFFPYGPQAPSAFCNGPTCAVRLHS